MKIPHFFSVFWILALSVGLAQEGLKKTPLTAGEDGYDGPMFERLSAQKTGLTHVNPILEDHPLARVYHSSSACGGVVIGDVNHDGKLDIFAAGGTSPNSLYLGQGDGLSFKNVAEEMGVAGVKIEWPTDEDAPRPQVPAGLNLEWGIGAAMVDVDNDGDLDIYLCQYDSPNRLWLNTLIKDGKPGAFGFEERAKEWGVDLIDGCVMPAFADYDRDGDLDLYVLCHQVYRADGRPEQPIEIVEKSDGKYYVGEKWSRWFELNEERGTGKKKFLYSEIGRPDYFLRNDGDRFTDITRVSGINTKAQWGNSSTWWDYNHDGWPDLYVGNDFKSPDFLYQNNGDGTFTEVSKERLRHTTWFSMGAVQSDLNNDGWTDFVLADMLPSSHYMQKASMGSMGGRLDELKYVGGARQLMRNAVYINTGTDQLLEGAWLTGLATTEWTWAIRSQDFDNDGLMDVYFTNGIPRQFNHSDLPSLEHEDLVGMAHWEHYKGTPMRREQNQVYQNQGDFQFKDTSRKWGLDHLGITYGASTADFDGDGRLELVTANLVDPISFYHNKGAGGNRMVFDFEGTRSNRFGIGVSVTLELPDGQKMVRQLFPAGGYLDGDDTIAHFGIGEATVAKVTVNWPAGQTQVFDNLAANHRYTVTEPDQVGVRNSVTKSLKPKNPMFTRSNVLDGYKHVEILFDDYARQPLLPYKLSQLGPGQAWGDMDGDGDPDFYLAGAAGQMGQLFRNDTERGSSTLKLTPQPIAAFKNDNRNEDTSCLFFDADGDGDLDLYVGSGSVECNPNADVLIDRLYINADGKGNFERAGNGVLPNTKESSSVVAAVDFDQDGDLDLFVGARSIPGKYPLSPKSSLLRNDGGKFTDATEVMAPELEEDGMVTSGLWSDVDADGWIDLLVTYDRGPVKIYKNSQGNKLTPMSNEDSGFEKISGWFNGIAGGDIDNDGDIDYVVTNLGANTQYKASVEMPELIFYGDFEGTGQNNIVEAMFEVVSGEVVCYPWRGLSCSSRAMPNALQHITTYDVFGQSHLTEVYPVQKLESAFNLTTTELRSLVMMNDGNGKFTVSPLPHLAQISTGYGVSLTDVDLDGKLDCYLVQNFFTTQPETGHFDSGLSFLLRGTGDPANPFTPVWPGESGLEVPGDAKSLTSVDVNSDGRNDFIIGQNDDDPLIFLNQTKTENSRPMRVRLTGKAGNLKAIGSRVTMTIPGFPAQTHEIRAGGGYLSQDNTDLIFAIPKSAKDQQLTLKIRWPDGTTAETKSNTGAAMLKLSQ